MQGYVIRVNRCKLPGQLLIQVTHIMHECTHPVSPVSQYKNWEVDINEVTDLENSPWADFDEMVQRRVEELSSQ